MRFCQPHWDALRAAIDERGLTALVAENGERAAQNLVRELQEGPSIDSFDPLMAAHNAIMGNAIGAAGPHAKTMMAPNADGSENCPICFLKQAHDAVCFDKECAVDFALWIGFAADDALAAWKALAS